MRKFRISIFISFLLVVAFLLISCGSNGNKTTNSISPTAVSTTPNIPNTSTTNHQRSDVSGNGTDSDEIQEIVELIDSARTIKIVLLEGSATVTDEYETADCFKGMNLYDGDKLTVNENSLLVIRFDSDKYVYLGENTTISVKSQGEDKYKTNVFVEKGKVLAEVRNQLGQDEEFFLSSNNSVMAVRGTVFGISVKKIADQIIQTYSVYKGVTELYVFDNKEGNLVSGKLTDVQNSKFEIIIPTEDVLDEDESYNDILDNWLEDVDNEYESSEGANEELDEVQITVGVPSEDEYQEIIDIIAENDGGNTVTYSNIVYKAEGYYGQYDGLAHSININVEADDYNIVYKTSEDGEYSETKPEFIYPGYYRVYYKITGEGYLDKEDYGVVQISKADLTINYKENIVLPGLVAGMDIDIALNKIDFVNYIDVIGTELDSVELAKVSYEGTGNLDLGTNLYELDIILPDNIKDYYNPTKAEISLTAYEVKLNNTNAIYNGTLYIGDISSFNKYNGVSEEELFNYAEFSVGSNELIYDSVEFNYEYKTEGYYELTKGENTVGVTIDCGDYVINTDVYFIFNDYRDQMIMDITVDDILVSSLGEDSYYYNTSNLVSSSGIYRISTEEIAVNFGNGSFDGYINLPTDIIDENSDSYTVSQTNILEFQVDATSDIEFLIFPDRYSKGVRKIISVYFSETPPSDFPTYDIKNSLSYYPGTNFDFVISESPVEYSLDGLTYQENLSIDELGDVNVYFKVGDTIVTKGMRTVSITTGSIKTDVLDSLSSPINLLSNDGRTLMYLYNRDSEYNSEYLELTSIDGSTISPIVDAYNIYTNMIRNAKYYNDLTNEEIEVEVYFSEQTGYTPDFTYEITAAGYLSLTGSVEFTFPYEYQSPQPGVKPEPIIEDNAVSYQLSVVNPVDRTVSLNDVDRVYASRIIYSSEEQGANYEVLYSIDEGSTWTDETPVFSEVGVYKVYVIYKTYNETSDSIYEYYITDEMTIIAIQNITVTE